MDRCIRYVIGRSFLKKKSQTSSCLFVKFTVLRQLLLNYQILLKNDVYCVGLVRDVEQIIKSVNDILGCYKTSVSIINEERLTSYVFILNDYTFSRGGLLL